MLGHQPVVASRSLHAVGTDPATKRSTLYAVSAATGQRGATVPLPGAAGSAVAVAEMVVVPPVDGPLVAFAGAQAATRLGQERCG